MADGDGGLMGAAGEGIIVVAPSLSAFKREEWQQLTGANRDLPGYNPFLSYDFLSSLESSGCVGRRTGWQPNHLRLEDGSGTFLGAVPCYAKSHSQGEYVFDHAWADAYERAGGQLLSEAAGLGALHAGHRPAPAGRARAADEDAMRRR